VGGSEKERKTAGGNGKRRGAARDSGGEGKIAENDRWEDANGREGIVDGLR
jgi:hypothetical protein